MFLVQNFINKHPHLTVPKTFFSKGNFSVEKNFSSNFFVEVFPRYVSKTVRTNIFNDDRENFYDISVSNYWSENKFKFLLSRFFSFESLYNVLKCHEKIKFYGENEIRFQNRKMFLPRNS